jgi:hypothetical protein
MGHPRDAALERWRLARLAQRLCSGRSGSGWGLITCQDRGRQRATWSQGESMGSPNSSSRGPSSSGSKGSSPPGIALNAASSASDKVGTFFHPSFANISSPVRALGKSFGAAARRRSERAARHRCFRSLLVIGLPNRAGRPRFFFDCSVTFRSTPTDQFASGWGAGGAPDRGPPLSLFFPPRYREPLGASPAGPARCSQPWASRCIERGCMSHLDGPVFWLC